MPDEQSLAPPPVSKYMAASEMFQQPAEPEKAKGSNRAHEKNPWCSDLAKEKKKKKCSNLQRRPKKLEEPTVANTLK